MVICAAAHGSIFEVNRVPVTDTAAIDALRAELFVRISTIAVLANFASGADEGTDSFQEDRKHPAWTASMQP